MRAITVSRLPRDPGPAAWNAILTARAPHPPLDGAIKADWLVIGAGFAGLAAARRLAQLHPADTIVVLEARAVAEGPAGRNSGFMIDLPHDLTSQDYGGDVSRDRERTALNRLAIAFSADAAREYGLTAEAFIKSGKINAAATDKGMAHNASYAAHLLAMGEPHEMLDATQMRALTGTDYYAGGLFTPGAAMIQPAMFVRGVADGLARGNRILLFENAPVTNLQREGTAWQAKTPSGSVSASKVILAVNGHAESFGFFKRRLMHVFTYASMTRALTADETRRLGGEPNWGFTPADPMGTTVRRISGTGGDRIIIRNRFTYDPSMEVSDARIARVGDDHDSAFRARFPMLNGVNMEYRWGGRLCLSRNDVPAFGEVDDGLYAACCQNGLGTAKGTLAGMLAAELASGVISDALNEMLREAAPAKLPPEPLAFIGANAIMRWGEFKAGREF
ncbi:FAD-binding oxidoreductase [Oricola sp.]|uniref:NAD(P)/FAD-dependent oxidoreductase n=1 Tax=Oricola sp. TaxID=1979950 RepID=UPI0025E2A320|nr:FAD-binding oxidoreductase [Oricola sp.]MCI5075079.1 FAD-binding oxidoreductase [Oricola sp.]